MIEVGPVTEKNSANIAEIISATFPVKYSADFFSSLDLSLCQLAYFGDVIVACVACKKQDKELYVLSLATLRAYRRRGLATALLRWTEDRARALACTEVSLHARESDSETIAFYVSRGFERAGCVSNYYPFPEDAVVLKKTI